MFNEKYDIYNPNVCQFINYKKNRNFSVEKSGKQNFTKLL